MRKNIKIFISYSWKDKKIVNKVDDYFKSLAITIIRDERTVKYKESIKEYMKRIRTTDYVLMIISDSFLKSSNCMYEVIEFIKDVNYNDRILPILLDDTKIYDPIESIEYSKYWDREYDRFYGKIKGLPVTSVESYIIELKHLQNIRDSIGPFIHSIKDMKIVLYNEVKKTGYREVLNHIGFNDEVSKVNLINWNSDNIACLKTWIHLKVLDQHNEVFSEAGIIRMYQLKFWNQSASAELRSTAAKTICSQLDNMFRLFDKAVYETGSNNSNAIEAMLQVMTNEENTILDLAMKVDDNYKFRGESN
ncbi:MAG: hypothetical protein A2057_04550 [Ignavibacteria bacterium GWA2_35_9]|nr:MAG: hypothetical protein A2057_04550 [Ignavibacteria bacterium GWA2_35_9]OGU48857.1 MAG: hypothetical protein A2080_15635 [Ignavibacteria bacterium GWC2_36_12]OGV03560.1 MAG: hypothetical protein A2330_03430 [Ignavibacteria bacterium RIFOXYB2_FULL_36_7]